MAREASQDQLLALRFEKLTRGFISRLQRHDGPSPRRIDLYRNLLEGFSQAYNRCAAQESREVYHSLRSFQSLTAGFANAIEKWRQREENSAGDFNLLELLDLTGKEIRHSMILAWLLDHDLTRLGTHAQGNLGFRLFLTELRLPSEYACPPYWVRREVEREESRVDIEIASRGRFLIHIENKVFSVEGADQTGREWRDAKRRAAELGVPDSALHALFLTRDNSTARDPHFRSFTWGQVARVLDAFVAAAKPPDVKVFCTHYAKALRMFVISDTQTKETEHGERTV